MLDTDPPRCTGLIPKWPPQRFCHDPPCRVSYPPRTIVWDAMGGGCWWRGFGRPEPPVSAVPPPLQPSTLSSPPPRGGRLRRRDPLLKWSTPPEAPDPTPDPKAPSVALAAAPVSRGRRLREGGGGGVRPPIRACEFAPPCKSVVAFGWVCVEGRAPGSALALRGAHLFVRAEGRLARVCVCACKPNRSKNWTASEFNPTVDAVIEESTLGAHTARRPPPRRTVACRRRSLVGHPQDSANATARPSRPSLTPVHPAPIPSPHPLTSAVKYSHSRAPASGHHYVQRPLFVPLPRFPPTPVRGRRVLLHPDTTAAHGPHGTPTLGLPAPRDGDEGVCLLSPIFLDHSFSYPSHTARGLRRESFVDNITVPVRSAGGCPPLHARSPPRRLAPRGGASTPGRCPLPLSHHSPLSPGRGDVRPRDAPRTSPQRHSFPTSGEPPLSNPNLWAHRQQ